MAPAYAQPPSADGDIDTCARIESAVARLDCFDELARRPADRGAAQPAPADSEPDREARSEPVQDAASMAPLPQRTPRVSKREERESERRAGEFTDRVASLRQIQPGRFEITLTNGQVWRQTNTDRYDLLPGHEVRLYPSGFGQYYRLTAIRLRGFVQVERVR